MMRINLLTNRMEEVASARRRGTAPKHQGRFRIAIACAATLLGVLEVSGSCAVAAPMQVTATSVDPLFTEPYVDLDEWRDKPVRHRYVHGGFKGTEARFSLYFPPQEQYQGRFFQPLMAVSGNENAAQSPASQNIGFAIASGGYMVESNLGRLGMFPGEDGTITGYRTSAAVAKYSRELATKMYGPGRIYGYVYGGSGGGYKTISGMENTVGVWDGSVPFIHATPMTLPSIFTAQAHALRVLKDKFPQIVDAVDPGGGDMYAGLNAEEREALLEVTRMGFPPRAWFNHQRIAFGYTGVFATLIDNMVKWDPTYFDDFWKVPGYLGANPTESLKRARIQHPTKIGKIVTVGEASKMGLGLTMATSNADNANVPAGFQMEALPQGDLRGATVILKSGAATGRTLLIVGVAKDVVLVGFGEDNAQAMTSIKAGDAVSIDNSTYLAAQTYQRHAVPPPEYYGWNQFRDAQGKPKYPQRKELIAPRWAEMGAGSIQNGKFNGKMIVVECLVDEAAYPWQADWYRTKVKQAFGARTDDNYRLWYVDHAMHLAPSVAPGDPRPVITTRIVSYTPVLQQALRDVSAWAEKGIAPPATSNYKVVDSQVEIPATAAERKGVQPVVVPKANGGARADVAVGQSVEFTGLIEAPPGTGSIVGAEWDFEGAGDYPVKEQFSETTKSSVNVKTSYAFSKPGTYFPALRAYSQRQGDAKTPYARIQNLGRVRVVVK
jgi:hypothetical protein